MGQRKTRKYPLKHRFLMECRWRQFHKIPSTMMTLRILKMSTTNFSPAFPFHTFTLVFGQQQQWGLKTNLERKNSSRFCKVEVLSLRCAGSFSRLLAHKLCHPLYRRSNQESCDIIYCQILRVKLDIIRQLINDFMGLWSRRSRSFVPQNFYAVEIGLLN